MSWIELKKCRKIFIVALVAFAAGGADATEDVFKSNLPSCEGSDIAKWNDCFGTREIHGRFWGKYSGEFKNGKFDGYGAYRDHHGDIYLGEWKNGKREGKGKVGSLDGYIFEAKWKDDLIITSEGKLGFQFAEKYKDQTLSIKRIEQFKTNKETHILYVNPNGLPYCSENKQKNGCWGSESLGGIHYEGEFKSGKYHGIGSWVFETGMTYLGNFKNNKPDGFGIYIHIQDQYYIGNLKEDRYFGEGIYLHKGTTIAGVWDDVKLKKPLLVEALASQYAKQLYYIVSRNRDLAKFIEKNIQVAHTVPSADGELKINIENKAPTCKGTDTSKWDNCYGEEKSSFTGITYQGMWSKGKKHGAGVNFFANGDKYVGNFRDDEWKDGKLTHSDGEEYQGEFKNGQRHGKGTYINSYGEKYVGNFKNDERDGVGTLEYENGDKYEGYWENGFRHGSGKMIFNSGDTYIGEFRYGEFHGKGAYSFASGEKYVGEYRDGKRNGFGIFDYKGGNKYIGEYKDGAEHGQGTLITANVGTFVGEWKDGKQHGQGIQTTYNGLRYEGIWMNGEFIREAKVNLPNINNNTTANLNRTELEREKAQNSQRLNLQITNTTPAVDGSYSISIQTNVDTASLKVNGEEQGGRADGQYVINRMARAGQETKLDIVAKDVYGNTDKKIITVSRLVAESKPLVAALNPAQVKKQPERDAVAIIIGIADYKNLPRADFANDDASVFYDYAIRALGIKPENIKLLVDANADDVAIYQAFKTWLPSRVRSTTDVYVYYSGHGLPAEDGKELYLLPQRAHRDLIEKTAISQKDINGFIQAAKPKSVTIFLDSCYSGLARSGETLLASARPVVLKSEKKLFPDNFTVLTASRADQISSSSPDLKHGIFSYYLMRGMEGEADADKDGRITAGEMHRYLSEQVERQAGMLNRKQNPQIIGDENSMLIQSP